MRFEASQAPGTSLSLVPTEFFQAPPLCTCACPAPTQSHPELCLLWYSLSTL